ncbi:MAG: hypothetical protein IE916_00030 [Epsilonproteobacteria bacterium]|nr:hypothetical protein [Campylobacterota bacterium]
MDLSLLDAESFVKKEIEALTKKSQGGNNKIEEVLNKGREIYGHYLSMKEGGFVDLLKKARNKETPSEELVKLSKNNSRIIKREVGKNPNTPFEARLKLHNDKKNHVSVYYLIMDKNATPEFLTAVAATHNRRVPEAMLLRNDLSFKTLEVILQRTDISDNKLNDPYYAFKEGFKQEGIYNGPLEHPSNSEELLSPKETAKALMRFKIKEFEATPYTPKELDEIMFSLDKQEGPSPMEVACCTLHENTSLNAFLIGCELLNKIDPAKLEIVKRVAEGKKAKMIPSSYNIIQESSVDTSLDTGISMKRQ